MSIVTREEVKAYFGSEFKSEYLDERITETGYGFSFDLSPDSYYENNKDNAHNLISHPGSMKIAKESRKCFRVHGNMHDTKALTAALAEEDIDNIETEAQLLAVMERMGKQPEILSQVEGGIGIND